MMVTPTETVDAPPQAPGGSLADQILNFATTWLGIPYQWGGNSRSGVDCSGLVQQVYNHFGLNLPRVSSAQARVGKLISAKNARPGDLVYFDQSQTGDTQPGIDHIGIYIGHGQMIVAPHTGTNVQIQPVGTAAGFDRVLPQKAFAGMAKGSGGNFQWTPLTVSRSRMWR